MFAIVKHAFEMGGKLLPKGTAGNVTILPGSEGLDSAYVFIPEGDHFGEVVDPDNIEIMP